MLSFSFHLLAVIPILQAGSTQRVDPSASGISLQPKRVGRTTIYSRLESLPVASSASHISLMDLASWRSPRGLDYSFSGQVIAFSSFDRSGSFSLNLQTGRITAANGVLKTLNGKTAVKVTYPDGYSQFFTADKKDYLLPIESLKAYLQGWSQKRDRGIVLKTMPIAKFSDAMDYPGPPNSKLWEINYKPQTQRDLRLEATVQAQAYKCKDTTNNASRSGIEYYFKARNLTDKWLVLQPSRFFVVMCSSLPAMLNQGSFPATNLYAQGQERYFGQSIVLAPKSTIERRFDEPLPEFDHYWRAKTLAFRYSDGASKFDFNLIARSKTSGINEIGRYCKL